MSDEPAQRFKGAVVDPTPVVVTPTEPTGPAQAQPSTAVAPEEIGRERIQVSAYGAEGYALIDLPRDEAEKLCTNLTEHLAAYPAG